MATRNNLPSVEFVIKAKENLSLEGTLRVIPRVKLGIQFPIFVKFYSKLYYRGFLPMPNG